MKIRKIFDFVKELYSNMDYIPLHSPVFLGNEKRYLNNCIETTFVSYVGEYVSKFEKMICKFTGSNYAVAFVNGTSALQIALIVSGVEQNDEVITQALTFVGTANGIVHSGAKPIFIDVDLDTCGMSPSALNSFLNENCYINEKKECINTVTNKRIRACVPVHIFGHPCKIGEIVEICNKWHIVVVEDAAESIGSFYKNKHTGTFGKCSILSFNGNKTITTGGGGMIITDDENLANHARHLSTTAKIPHQYEFYHNEIGYNLRMTNVNAAIGVAQMESINQILDNKRVTAEKYKQFCLENDIKFIGEPEYSKSNFWLNSIILNNKIERDELLRMTNENRVMTRPIWTLMNKLPMYEKCQTDELKNSLFLEERVVSLPSGYRK